MDCGPGFRRACLTARPQARHSLARLHHSELGTTRSAWLTGSSDARHSTLNFLCSVSRWSVPWIRFRNDPACAVRCLLLPGSQQLTGDSPLSGKRSHRLFQPEQVRDCPTPIDPTIQRGLRRGLGTAGLHSIPDPPSLLASSPHNIHTASSPSSPSSGLG